jgi:hypothetical protein
MGDRVLDPDVLAVPVVDVDEGPFQGGDDLLPESLAELEQLALPQT